MLGVYLRNPYAFEITSMSGILSKPNIKSAGRL
jgi:hypothetical protein